MENINSLTVEKLFNWDSLVLEGEFFSEEVNRITEEIEEKIVWELLYHLLEPYLQEEEWEVFEPFKLIKKGGWGVLYRKLEEGGRSYYFLGGILGPSEMEELDQLKGWQEGEQLPKWAERFHQLGEQLLEIETAPTGGEEFRGMPVGELYSQLSRLAFRGYPLDGVRDFKIWRKIISSPEANLPLSPEQWQLLYRHLGGYLAGERPRYPIFITGRAGSGKSTLLRYLLGGYLLALQKSEGEGDFGRFPVLLTYNRELRDEGVRLLREMIKTNPLFYSIGEGIVEGLIKNLEGEGSLLLEMLKKEGSSQLLGWRKASKEEILEILEGCHPRLPGRERVPIETVWFVIRSYLKGRGRLVSGKEKGELKFKEYTVEEYLRLQPRADEKLVDEKVFERIAKEVYPCYRNRLRERRLYDQLDLVMEVLRTGAYRRWEGKFKYLLCDEAQDFTMLEFQLLLQLLDFNSQRLEQLPVIFAGDQFQTITPTGFRFPFLRTTLYGGYRRVLLEKGLKMVKVPKLEQQGLSYNFRSTGRLIEFNNGVLAGRWQLLRLGEESPAGEDGSAGEESPVGEEVENGEIRGLLQRKWREGERGRVLFLDLDRHREELEQYLDGEPELRVVLIPDEPEVLEEFFEGGWPIGRWEKGKGDPLFGPGGRLQQWLQKGKDRRERFVETPLSFKGREKEIVVLYRFGDYYNYLRKREGWADLYNLPTRFQDQLQYQYFLNRLYVATSRGKSKLVIVDSREGWEQFWQPLLEVGVSKLVELGELDPAVEVLKRRGKGAEVGRGSSGIQRGRGSPGLVEEVEEFEELIDTSAERRKSVVELVKGVLKGVLEGGRLDWEQLERGERIVENYLKEEPRLEEYRLLFQLLRRIEELEVGEREGKLLRRLKKGGIIGGIESAIVEFYLRRAFEKVEELESGKGGANREEGGQRGSKGGEIGQPQGQIGEQREVGEPEGEVGVDVGRSGEGSGQIGEKIGGKIGGLIGDQIEGQIGQRIGEQIGQMEEQLEQLEGEVEREEVQVGKKEGEEVQFGKKGDRNKEFISKLEEELGPVTPYQQWQLKLLKLRIDEQWDEIVEELGQAKEEGERGEDKIALLKRERKWKKFIYFLIDYLIVDQVVELWEKGVVELWYTEEWLKKQAQSHPSEEIWGWIEERNKWKEKLRYSKNRKTIFCEFVPKNWKNGGRDYAFCQMIEKPSELLKIYWSIRDEVENPDTRNRILWEQLFEEQAKVQTGNSDDYSYRLFTLMQLKEIFKYWSDKNEKNAQYWKKRTSELVLKRLKRRDREFYDLFSDQKYTVDFFDCMDVVNQSIMIDLLVKHGDIKNFSPDALMQWLINTDWMKCGKESRANTKNSNKVKEVLNVLLEKYEDDGEKYFLNLLKQKKFYELEFEVLQDFLNEKQLILEKGWVDYLSKMKRRLIKTLIYLKKSSEIQYLFDQKKKMEKDLKSYRDVIEDLQELVSLRKKIANLLKSDLIEKVPIDKIEAVIEIAEKEKKFGVKLYDIGDLEDCKQQIKRLSQQKMKRLISLSEQIKRIESKYNYLLTDYPSKILNRLKKKLKEREEEYKELNRKINSSYLSNFNVLQFYQYKGIGCEIREYTQRVEAIKWKQHLVSQLLDALNKNKHCKSLTEFVINQEKILNVLRSFIKGNEKVNEIFRKMENYFEVFEGEILRSDFAWGKVALLVEELEEIEQGGLGKEREK